MAPTDPRAGMLPAWNVTDLPPPPRFTFRNALAVLGPGTIALSMSIGTGEWILGPAVTVKYGTSLLWIVTLAVLLQLTLNLEFIRYTVYTGEPVVNGFMRTRPGPAFWAVFYIALALCQVGWPAWAKSSASVTFALLHERLPGTLQGVEDKPALFFLGIVPFLATIAIVSVGGRIERMLEWVNKIMVVYIVGFLLTICILFVEPRHWWEGLIGHAGLTEGLSFSFIPEGADFVLLAAFAGFAANGGIGNVWTSNWIRDKGFGMGSVVGYIASAVGGKKVHVSPVGSVFPVTRENVARWREWWKYVHVDQTLVWTVGCFVGMYLNVLIARAIIQPGTDLEGLAVGAYQAQFLAEHGGRLLWYLTLINGFWILFGSQLAIVDGFVRLSTDIIWTGSARVRALCKDDIRWIYYALLFAFAAWGCAAMTLEPGKLVKLAANAAAFILVVAGIHVIVLNRRFLPRELQAPLWQRGAVVLAVLFYGFFSLMSMGQYLGWWSGR